MDYTNENKKYLEIFEAYLREKGLSDNTISTHMGNAAFYISTFLPWAGRVTLSEGCFNISEFFGHYFIRKCMWSTPATIKSTAASLKKFYKCMMENGFVEETDYKNFCEEVKYEMEDWQETCRQYNDPAIENPFFVF